MIDSRASAAASEDGERRSGRIPDSLLAPQLDADAGVTWSSVVGWDLPDRSGRGTQRQTGQGRDGPADAAKTASGEATLVCDS